MLDTSVLLADPSSLFRFEEHRVVLPVVVLMELEAKRHHPELGFAARHALRALEELRRHHGGLADEVPLNERGGTLRVELNHLDRSWLPPSIAGDNNDHRILAVARALADEGERSVVVTKDLPLRLKASVLGMDAEEYRNELAGGDGWSGMVRLEAGRRPIDELYTEGVLDLDEARDLPVNAGVVLSCGSQSALARLRDDKRLHLVQGDLALFDVRGRSAEQRLALDLLADDSVGIVSLGGPAGTGKTVLALAAGLHAVLEARTHRRVVVFRPLHAVGGQELGYLPGTMDEKMGPHAAAVTDALESITSDVVIDQVVAARQLEVLPLTHIRGRSLRHSWIVVEEAQNLERATLFTALSRLGEGSRVVLTHDVAQRDNLRVGRYDGIAAVVERLKNHPLFGHITLARAERSPVAALVTQLLDG